MPIQMDRIAPKGVNGLLEAANFPGVDIGAKINAAVAFLGASGGKILIAAGTYSYTTPIVITDNITLEGAGQFNTNLSFTPSNAVAVTLGHVNSTGVQAIGISLRDLTITATSLVGVTGLAVKECNFADIRNVYLQVATAGGNLNTNTGILDDGSTNGGTQSFGNNWNHFDHVTCQYFNVGYKAKGTVSPHAVSDTELHDCKFLNNRSDGTHDGTIGISIPAANTFGIKFIGGCVHAYDIGADVSGQGTLFNGVLWEISDTQTATIRLNSGAKGNIVVNSPDLSSALAITDNSGNLTNVSFNNATNANTYLANRITASILLGDLTFDSSADRNILGTQNSAGTKALSIQPGIGSGQTGATLELGGGAHATLPGSIRLGLGSSNAGRSIRINSSGYGVGTDIVVIDASGNVVINGTCKSAGEILTAAAPAVAAAQVGLGSTVASTVGAAGGASALPATPLGYLIANVAGTQVKIPYYNN